MVVSMYPVGYPQTKYIPNNKNKTYPQNNVQQSKEKKELSTGTKIAIATTVGTGLALLVDYFVFKGKYSKKAINYIKNLFKKPTTQTTQKPPTGSTTAGGTTGMANTVQQLTPAEQAQALNKLHETNAIQRAELNSIKNNARGAEKLEQVAVNIQKENAVLNKLGTNTITHANGNVYHLKDGKVVKVDLYNRCKDGTLKFNKSLESELKIAKHLSKQNVSFA